MAFVIDSSEWNFQDLDAESVSLRLEQLLERVSIANERGECVYVGNDLQSQYVCDTMDLWTFLYDDSMVEVDGGIIDELAAFLNSAKYYEDDSSSWPNGFPEHSVFDKDTNEVSLDLAFAHFHVLSSEPYGCISLNEEESLDTKSVLGSVNIRLINDEKSHKSFWRNTALTLVRDTAQNLEELSPHMYPNLHFFKDVWKGMSNFEGSYARVSKTLQKYLAGFDDYGAWIFNEPPPAVSPTDTVKEYTGKQPTNALIEQRFLGIGLEMAPEKPDVFRNKDCREAREILFRPDSTSLHQEVLYCEWHGKFEKHINRIHIHSPIKGSDGKVIIAIYHKHLPLPKNK